MIEIVVINLDRRADKRHAMTDMANRYGYQGNLRWHTAIDGSEHDIDALLQLLELSNPPEGEIIATNYPEWGKNDLKAHLAFRKTYLDVLESITEPTIVLIDDQFLTCQMHIYDQIVEECEAKGIDIVALDPITETTGLPDLVVYGYKGFTEEAILWMPRGAKDAQPILVEHTELVIGDAIRIYYPRDRQGSTSIRVARHIGKKADWQSDIHLEVQL